MSDDIRALLEEMREIRKALTDLEKMARQQAYKNSFLRLGFPGCRRRCDNN